MYVCLCKNVTDKQIRSTIDQGAASYPEVRQCLGVGTQCGRCASLAKSVVKECLEDQFELATPAAMPACA